MLRASPDNPATGALIGGVTGAALGNVIGENPARQERELNRQLDGSGAQITNTGNQLLVVLPEGVTFPTGSSTVNPGFLPALRQIAQSLRNYPNSTVRVVGHTDNVGTIAFNSQLSRDRALAVARILVNDGVPSNRITYSGHGFAEPVASNSTASGRALNRRVEIVITPTTGRGSDLRDLTLLTARSSRKKENMSMKTLFLTTDRLKSVKAAWDQAPAGPKKAAALAHYQVAERAHTAQRDGDCVRALDAALVALR